MNETATAQGSYAADGVGDDWQFQYFGLNNPNAAPLLDPDGDGQNNLFEFTAGLVPTNPLSRFLVSIAPVPGQPTHRHRHQRHGGQEVLQGRDREAVSFIGGMDLE